MVEDARLVFRSALPSADPVRTVDFPVEDAFRHWFLRLAGREVYARLWNEFGDFRRSSGDIVLGTNSVMVTL